MRYIVEIKTEGGHCGSLDPTFATYDDAMTFAHAAEASPNIVSVEVWDTVDRKLMYQKG